MSRRRSSVTRRATHPRTAASVTLYVYEREECCQCEGSGERHERAYVTGDGTRRTETVSCSACEGSGTIDQILDSVGDVDFYPNGTEPSGSWEVDGLDDLPREWDEYTRDLVRGMITP
jgi:hypothetical protein